MIIWVNNQAAAGVSKFLANYFFHLYSQCLQLISMVEQLVQVQTLHSQKNAKLHCMGLQLLLCGLFGKKYTWTHWTFIQHKQHETETWKLEKSFRTLPTGLLIFIHLFCQEAISTRFLIMTMKQTSSEIWYWPFSTLGLGLTPSLLGGGTDGALVVVLVLDCVMV